MRPVAESCATAGAHKNAAPSKYTSNRKFPVFPDTNGHPLASSLINSVSTSGNPFLLALPGFFVRQPKRAIRRPFSGGARLLISGSQPGIPRAKIPQCRKIHVNLSWE